MDESSTLEAVLVEVHRVQSSCRADSGDRFDAALSDDVGLHLELGRRFFFFTVQRNATNYNEVSAESARERVRTVTEVLMSSAEEQRFNTRGAVHWTWRWTNSHGPIIKYLRSNGLGFPLDLYDSGGPKKKKKKKKKKKTDQPTVFFCGMLAELDNFFGAAL